MKLLCSSFPAWQARQVSETCLAVSFSKVLIFVLSPSASTCALPGPWHDSQPVTLPFQPAPARRECVVCEKLLDSTSWQAAQVSLPTSSSELEAAPVCACPARGAYAPESVPGAASRNAPATQPATTAHLINQSLDTALPPLSLICRAVLFVTRSDPTGLGLLSSQ